MHHIYLLSVYDNSTQEGNETEYIPLNENLFLCRLMVVVVVLKLDCMKYAELLCRKIQNNMIIENLLL